MEDFIDFKRIKEEIIETDSIIKKNAELEKNILKKKKQLKQLTNDFNILKLEYEYKLFQFEEKKKQCDYFKTDNVNLESENSSIKEQYNKSLNDYQVLHIKYQTMCKDLEESLESLEKRKITDSPVKAKTGLKRKKREISEAFDDNAGSGSDFSAESDEEGKLLEKRLSEIPEHTQEDRDMNPQEQCSIPEVENTSNLKMRITYLTSSNNILKEEVANCKEKIKTLNIILQNKEIEWSEKEKKLTTELEELKKCLEYNNKQNNSIINTNQSIFDIEEEKVELQKGSSKENLSDLSNKRELQGPIDSFVGVDSPELACNLKSIPTHESLNSTLDKDIVSSEIELNLPSFAENEDLSDEETNTADINDILNEMRIHYRLLSPVPELHRDSVCLKSCTTTSELSKLQSSTEKISIAAKHESDIHNYPRNDRYNKQRQLKAKIFHKLITRKKARNLYWKRKLEFIHKSETCKSKIKRSTINTPENNVDAPMNKNEKDYCLNKNASVDSIITVLADLVSQKLKYPPSRKKSVRLNQCDDSKNVLEVNKMLLRKARQSMTTIGYEKIQNSSSFERSSSELDIPIFDSCYESLNSNPPSIENIINDNKSKIDWLHQNKNSSEGGNTGESQSPNMNLNVQESHKNDTHEKEKSVILPENGKERYSMSPQSSGNFQMEHELGSIHELISSNVGKKISKINKIEENSIFKSSINCLKDHCSNIQKDGLNEVQKPGNQKEIDEKIYGDVKPIKHTETLENVHPNSNNLIMIDNLVLSIEHPQVQSGKYNFTLSSSGSEIHKNTESAGNDNVENIVSNTNEMFEKDSTSAGNDKVESEISNLNKIEENSSFESKVNCLKDCSFNNQYDAWKVAQKSRSYSAEVPRHIDAGIRPKYHIEPIEHVHQEIFSDIDDTLILNKKEDPQIQSGKYNLNSGNSELEINKNTISVENGNDKSENTNKGLEKNVNCQEVDSFNIEDTQKFGKQFEGIAEKINEDMEPKKQTETLDHVHPIINNLEIGDNLILGVEENTQIQTRKCDLKVNNSQLKTNENIKSKYCNTETKINNTNKTLKENTSESNLNCMKVPDLDIQSDELNSSGFEPDENIKSTENVNIEMEMSNTNKILREYTRFESNLNCMKVPNFNNQNDELIETQKCQSHFEEITERINENLDHVHSIVKNLEISNNENFEEIAEKIHEDMNPQKQIEDLHYVHPVINNLEIGDNTILGIEKTSLIQTRKYGLKTNNSKLETDKNIKFTENVSIETEISNKNELLKEDTRFESNLNCMKVPNFNNQNDELIETQQCQSHFEEITERINENMKPENLDHLHTIVKDFEISNNKHLEEISEKINEDMKPQKQMGTPDHVHTIINNLVIVDNLISGIEENQQIQTRKCDFFQLNNSQLESDENIKFTKNLNTETKISNTNELLKENTLFENNLNCLKVHNFNQNDELIEIKKCQIHFEETNGDVEPENVDHRHTIDKDLDMYETGSLSSSELEINKDIAASENDIKLIEMKNKRSVLHERSNINEEYHCKSMMISEKNNEESTKNENINILYDKMYHYRFEEEGYGRIENIVKGGCNDENIEIDKQNQCEDRKRNTFELLCKLKDLNKNNETLQNEQSKKTHITKYHSTEVIDLNVSQIENKICERNLHNTLQITERDIQNLKSQKEDDKCKIEYSNERDYSSSEKVLQKSEEYHDYLKSVYNSNLTCINNSGKIVHDQVQMKTDAELVGTTVSAMTEFQSDDLNNCYKIFHYNDNISSESFENYTDTNSIGARERNSWREPTNRSNERMWYDFGHNSLVDIRKSKSYHESDVNCEQNLYTNDFETSKSKKLTSYKRFNEDKFESVCKIFKSEGVSSSCESVHSSPMAHETKYIQHKMKLYPSESKNIDNSTHENTDCKTKISTNKNMGKDWVKVNNNSIQKVKNDYDDDLVKSCMLNFNTNMDIDLNISQHLLEENCLNLCPSICIPPMINNLSGDTEYIHTNHSKEDDSISVDHLLKKNQTQLSECSENLLKNVDSNSNKSIISEDYISSIELSNASFSKNCDSNCTKLENVQLDLCLNDKKTTNKRKSSRNSKTVSKVVVSNYNLRKSSKFKKEENLFVPSASDTLNNISLNTSDINNTCVGVKETSGIGLKYRNLDSVLTSSEETDLFGSLSESSDDELLSSRNPNKMSKTVLLNINSGECQKLEKKMPCSLSPETMKSVSPNYSNNVNCQNDENTSSNVNLNCIKSKNLQEFSEDIDLFGSYSESSEDECSVSSNCTKMLKTLGTNHIFRKTLKQEEENNHASVEPEMLKNISFNSSCETGLQEFNREMDLFGSLSETSNDGFCSNEFDTNCKPTTPKRRKKSYKCNTQQRKKKVAKKGLLMKKSIRTYRDKNLALNSAEKKIIFHNGNTIETNSRSNIQESLENNLSTDLLSNQWDSHFPQGLSHYKNIQTSSDSQNNESKQTENDTIKLQSTIFKRSRNSSGTYSINSIRPTSGLKNITKKIKKESQTSSSTFSNGIHDVKDKQNIEVFTTSELQQKNVSLNMGINTAICENSEKNCDIALKTTTTTHEELTQSYDTSRKKLRQSLMNPANVNEHKSSKKNLKLKSRYNFLIDDNSNSGYKDNNNPSGVPLTLNKANVANCYPKEEKINILQEVVIRPSKANPNKLEIHAPAQMRVSGFKRPNNSKVIPTCPLSPTPPTAEEIVLPVEPIIIPLEKPAKMETSKAAALFRKLITYSKEEKTVEEISRQFTSQDVDHISRLVLEQITQDTEKANKDDTSAPLMTDTQRVMLGFMLKLEQMNVENLIATYLKISEARLLQVNTLQELDTITRLYVAICKSHKYIGRIRRMCCDAFYFMGDFAIPFFFIILVSWIQVLPMEEEMENFPIVKVLIQLVNLKSCNFPGYNLLPLRDLLNKYYKYPIEPWNNDNFFRELFNNYMKNPVRPNDFAILLYCKNNSSKWVNEKINNLIRPTLEIIKKENLKATVIILISNIISQFNGKLDGEYVDSARQWLKCMIEGEDITEVIKESIIISLRKLPKTPKNLKVAML